MGKINNELLKKYVVVLNQYQDLTGKLRSGEIQYEELLKRVDVRSIEIYRKECAEEYSERLGRSENYVEEYKADINAAILEENLYAIEILITAREYIAGLIVPEIDICILQYLGSFFDRKHGDKNDSFAKYLFEQVLDTAEDGREEYIDVLDLIFSSERGKEWYDDFYNQIDKLVQLAAYNKHLMDVLEKGLTNTSEAVRSNLKEYIDYYNSKQE